MVRLIWATRGRSWGFRFLCDGGYADPLPVYEATFEGMENDYVVCCRLGDRVALRFPDPLDRRDSAGRVIPHDFVVPGPLANNIETVDDGRNRVWPLVADHYERLWQESTPTEMVIL